MRQRSVESKKDPVMRNRLGVYSGWAIGFMVTGLILAVGLSAADARPKYKSTFQKQYPKVVEKNKKIACDACHVPEKKKTERNNYGQALLKTLKEVVKEIPEKGVTDIKKIKEALKKAEKEKSAVKDRTFGDLLKEGKLPASK